MEQLKKVEADQKFYQDHDAHLIQGDLVVKVIFYLVVICLSTIGLLWVIDNAIVPLVKMFHG